MAKAKKSGKKWMQKAVKHPGALHRRLHVPQGKNIPMSTINSKIAALKKKKKLTASERTLLKQLVLARTFKRRGK